MKKFALLLVPVLVLSGCAGFAQLRCVVTACGMGDGQLDVVTGKPLPLISVAADAAQPGLAALASFALNAKQIGALGVLLPVKEVGQTATRFVVCPSGKLGAACLALGENKPAKIWVHSLAGSPDLFELTKID